MSDDDGCTHLCRDLVGLFGRVDGGRDETERLGGQYCGEQKDAKPIRGGHTMVVSECRWWLLLLFQVSSTLTCGRTLRLLGTAQGGG
jgi:hypothetical protein